MRQVVSLNRGGGDRPAYKLDSFEGPLDLLLVLIAKNKLNIYDISITVLLEQYMAQVDQMRRENMEICSEFLEMAARLVHMKTVSLLPKQEEAEELKLALSQQLMAYQRCKEVAQAFSERIRFDRKNRNQEEIPMDFLYRGDHTPLEIRSALLMAIGKGRRHLPPKPESFSALVSKPIISVTSQVISLLRQLLKNAVLSYGDIFRGKSDRSERVAAFLAVLELVKGKRIFIEGEGEESQVKLLDENKDSRKNGLGKSDDEQ